MTLAYQAHPPPPRVAPTEPRLATEPAAAEACVAALIGTEVDVNDAKKSTTSDGMTAFHALEPPSIHVRDYVHRLASYSFSSTACLIAAVHYVKRAVAKDPRLAPTSLSVHRLLITALVLAAKFFDDVTYSMSYYAKVGGLPVKELAYLELKLLSLLDFRLHIPTYAYHTLERDLIDALTYVPRSLIVSEAAKLISCANIRTRPDYYCEALHPDDAVGYWLHHPSPHDHMLTCMEVASSPCHTPPRALSPSVVAQNIGALRAKANPQAGAASVGYSYLKGNEGNGPLSRFSSACSAATVESYDGTPGHMDEGQSGPLYRHASNASTLTSEGSGCSELSSSVYSEGDGACASGWVAAASGSRAQYYGNVYCRLGGNMRRN